MSNDSIDKLIEIRAGRLKPRPRHPDPDKYEVVEMLPMTRVEHMKRYSAVYNYCTHNNKIDKDKLQREYDETVERFGVKFSNSIYDYAIHHNYITPRPVPQ